MKNGQHYNINHISNGKKGEKQTRNLKTLTDSPSDKCIPSVDRNFAQYEVGGSVKCNSTAEDSGW